MQSTKQAVFMLGEEEFGLDIMDISIIEKAVPIEPVAGFPKNLKGIIRLRGDIIPIFSLRRKFGLPDTPADSDTRFIITTSEGIPIAFEVDRMLQIAEVEAENMYEVPSIFHSADTAYIKAITNLTGKLVIILDHDGILTQEEQSKIKTNNTGRYIPIRTEYHLV
jgi:purine-binding chemotaxis protein CheW